MFAAPLHLFQRVGAAALLAGMLATGCSGSVASASDASTTSTHALLSVERTSAAGDEPSSVRAHASAYFVRLQSGADRSLAARLVGAAGVLPPVGQCENVGVLSDQGMPLASLGPVDLADVGEVLLEASATRATLAARAFPDVVDLVSGVVYTTRDLVADSLPAQGTYTFRVSGSGSLPAMALAARAPAPASDLTVAGIKLGAESITVPRADLGITWQPTEGTDLVYVELSSTDDGPLERVRCSFANAGRAVIALAALPRATNQSITVHQVHREDVTAPGLDGGEIRFDLATSGTLRVTAPSLP
ncbi:MAG TPA: hypothetical protein VJT73_07250 [Polyangiaceae bacterium]|nr:hypothetical protein [Polyangiaceae bacterium]